MGYAKLSVTFSSPVEIRMGSPFKVAEVKLVGKWTPELPDYDWQNLSEESTNGRFVALIAWPITNSNAPAFRIIVIDKKEKKLHESDRIMGCCTKLG